MGDTDLGDFVKEVLMNTEAKRTIVVGVDGSPDAARALRWAHRRGPPARACAAAGARRGDRRRRRQPVRQRRGARAVARKRANEVLDEAVASVRAEGVEVDGRVEVGSAAHALIEASREAELLVVGCRGHGGFVGLLLGSVSAACAHHAHCPVVVVRPEEPSAE